MNWAYIECIHQWITAGTYGVLLSTTMSASASEPQWGYLVTARYKNVSTFPVYTVVGCDTGAEAIETVLGMGFAFSRGCWVLRAVRVAVLPRDTAKPAAA